MLHKSKSTRNALLKYGLSAPLFAAMMILSSASFKTEKVAERISDVSSEALSLIQPETDYERFLKRNSAVERLEWRTFTHVFVFLKSGKKESYELNNPADLKKAEGLYGQFPSPPPPPPPTFEANANFVSSVDVEGPLFSNVENSPEFPGGMEAFYEYFAKTFKYTAEARAANVSGKLIMYFIVEKDGSLTKIQAIRTLGSGLDEEAVKVLENSPRWTPGTKDGKAVRVYYTLPISVRSPAQKTGSITIRNTKADGLELTGVDQKALYFVDGKEVKAESIKTIDPASIKSVNVLKGENGKVKYGDKGKDGVVEIYVNANPPIVSSTSVQSGKTLTQLGELVLSPEQAESDRVPFHGLVIINGKEAANDDGKAFNRIEANDIESVNVLKGESAIKKYGDQGKEGVIEITLKKK